MKHHHDAGNFAGYVSDGRRTVINRCLPPLARNQRRVIGNTPAQHFGEWIRGRLLLSSLMTLKNDLQLLPDVVVQFPAHHWFRDEVKRRYSSFRVRGNRYMRLSADGEITDGLSGMRT